MNKLLITLFALIASAINMNAQALFYIPAGEDPKTIGAKVFYYSNGALIEVVNYASNSEIRSKIMEDPNYYERKGMELNGKRISGPIQSRSSNLMFLRQSNGYNFYYQNYYEDPRLFPSAKTVKCYHAFSSNWNTYVENPTDTDPKYWTRVDKSNFELSF